MFPNLQKRFLVAVFCEAFLGGSLRVPCWWKGVLIGCYAIFLCGSGSLWVVVGFFLGGSGYLLVVVWFLWVLLGDCASLWDFPGRGETLRVIVESSWVVVGHCSISFGVNGLLVVSTRLWMILEFFWVLVADCGSLCVFFWVIVGGFRLLWDFYGCLWVVVGFF